MHIGIVGAGYIGGTLTRLFAKAGHQVWVANSRGPESLKGLVEEIGINVTATTREGAVEAGEIVVLATHWFDVDALPVPETLLGKIVIDTMNPYKRGGIGIIDLGDKTPSEETAKRLPGTRLVKAFNTIWWKHLVENGRSDLPVDERRAIFVASDDADAKAIVSQLIEDIGFSPVDSGNLRVGGRFQDTGSPIYSREITGAQGRTAIEAMRAANWTK